MVVFAAARITKQIESLEVEAVLICQVKNRGERGNSVQSVESAILNQVRRYGR